MKPIALATTAVLWICTLMAVGQTNHSIPHNGINRTFTVFRPADAPAGAKLPLLLALHGFTQNGPQMMNYSQFNNLATQHGFMVVYPNGINTSWNVGQSGNSGADDVGFLLALTDTLDQWYGVDQQRVYACGFSNGGFMSFRLACEASGRIAAIASVAGTMTSNTFNSCAPQRAVPVLHIHGTNDLLVGYNGSSGFKSVAEGMAYWASFNQCPENPEIIDLPDLVPEGSTVQQLSWAPCAQNTMVRHQKVINGGHTWPGFNGLMGIGNVNMDISASAEIWNFLSQFSLDQAVGNLSPTPGNYFRIFPNPAQNNLIYVEAPGFGPSRLEIVGSDGRLWFTGQYSLSNGRLVIPAGQLPAGMYLLRLSNATQQAMSKLVIGNP
ncbi:MAG: T9SS type A sorting domain-containing protein [Bacteroidetes bacterium]|nr:T9SS type A sorting domain-containing protein [Bacteroidota bacterium]